MGRFYQRLLLISVIMLSNTYAQQHSGKLAYVNTLTLLNSAPQRSALTARLRVENDKMQSVLSEMNKELALLTEQLEEETDLAKKDELRKQVLDKKTLFTRRSEAIQDSFLLKRNDEISAFQKLINEVIAETAKKRQLDAVLTQASVVYVNPKIDITNAVMEALTQRHEAQKSQPLSHALPNALYKRTAQSSTKSQINDSFLINDLLIVKALTHQQGDGE